MSKRYPAPKIVAKQDGNLRRVGFELEFSGVALEDAARVLQAQLGVEGRKDSAASWSLDVASHGTFQVELDWDFLKRMADERGEGQDDAAWLETLGKASALLVPVEVVCPPLALRVAQCLGMAEGTTAFHPTTHPIQHDMPAPAAIKST